jgi:hypothetical protein
MKITILKSTVCGGLPVKPGDVVEASAKDAFYLTATKAAIATPDEELADDAPAERKTRGNKKSPVNRMVDEDDLETRD